MMFLNSFANLFQLGVTGLLGGVVTRGLNRPDDLVSKVLLSAKPTHFWLAEEAPAPGSMTPILIGCGLLVLAVVVGVLVWKGKSKPKTREARSESPSDPAGNPAKESASPAPAVAPSRSNLIKAQNQGQLPKTKPPSTNSAWKKPVLSDRASSGSVRESSSRKRTFDYNRYFADLMSTVEGHTGSAESGNASGYQSDTTQYTNPQTAAEGGASPAGVTPQADLIASQASLIEEQRHMIQEQSKLIEEKNRIIAEKDRLLKRQSAPAGQQV